MATQQRMAEEMMCSSMVISLLNLHLRIVDQQPQQKESGIKEHLTTPNTTAGFQSSTTQQSPVSPSTAKASSTSPPSQRPSLSPPPTSPISPPQPPPPAMSSPLPPPLPSPSPSPTAPSPTSTQLR
ncbi:uncharacterized protein MONOS_5160 [Monocercomonoides exilis]|uniref:uncharacterized protein n=1 Tax=Monocercomonoides exilis TaxID=2049356 RepID=UPI003559955D|nr:hypothetical protein MONOS_5160 [Monocercomonoides exilis]|eukprot:MONOS_5160.1-p1 / transcript=MONOS_5160.1 / gene=MONOS_5160 / organism=Monocercomonoides_exilis_PA203 / gene_product=unspecified product / transcript_product=unspecified product / location=Mono_scaffold00147:37598-37975(-) / protein_length=126 / sequence_SO=supercontig / SO=protein_coding / is_pseudo=false